MKALKQSQCVTTKGTTSDSSSSTRKATSCSSTLRHFFAIATLGLCSLLAPAQAAGLLVPINASGNDTGLRIKSHDVTVVVEEGYAITQVDQIFHNPQSSDLEASYRFPVPDKAAVSEFTVWIDNQPVIGEVLEKAQARAVYQEEKAAGRVSGLLKKISTTILKLRLHRLERVRIRVSGWCICNRSTLTPELVVMFIHLRTAKLTTQPTLSGWRNPRCKSGFLSTLKCGHQIRLVDYVCHSTRMPQ